MLGATLLAAAFGCKQCKQPTEAAAPVRAVIELPVVNATRGGLAMNLPQANLATQAAPSPKPNCRSMTKCAPREPTEEQRGKQLSEEQR